jgi:hypothetical protein
MIIPIDFLAGSHGNFLETVLNKYFGFVANENTLTSTGTSHNKSTDYLQQRVFWARHWFENYQQELKTFEKIISVRFSQDDLLLLSSVSLLRAGDMNINNDSLEVNTRSKLNNEFYKGTLDLIYQSYPFLDPKSDSIERYILREFFKFGFRDPDHNGYWIKQQQMTYPNNAQVFCVDFDSFYDIGKLENTIRQLEVFVDRSFDFSAEFYLEHKRFLSFIPYCDHKNTCDQIVQAVLKREDIAVPPLTLFQESYINGTLERLFQREMPYHQPDYFTSTKDMLYYINHTAPNL